MQILREYDCALGKTVIYGKRNGRPVVPEGLRIDTSQIDLVRSHTDIELA
ncbi:hypothetical protein AOX55_00006655 (plasmid) [Sinorhizobium fredii CCBAU 25509]|nr:hypothetical protein AOX55_00006655 [Sinorhizobium fredii CCBAU 25509]